MRLHAALACLPLLLVAACSSVAQVRFSDRDAPNTELRTRLDAPLAPADLDLDKQPLEKVLTDLARQNHFNLVVHWNDLASAGVQGTSPVSVHLRNVTCRDAINLILADVNSTTSLDCAVIQGVLHVSTSGDLEYKMPAGFIRQAYDVRDLVTRQTATGPADQSRRMAYLMDLIIAQTWIYSWRYVQYPATTRVIDRKKPERFLSCTEPRVGEGVISAFGATLIITQTPDMQAHIAYLLEQLRQK